MSRNFFSILKTLKLNNNLAITIVNIAMIINMTSNIPRDINDIYIRYNFNSIGQYITSCSAITKKQ